MKYTKNLGLKLPEATDLVKVSDFNENFEELDKVAGAYEVGDLRSTLRTDLGDRWLLCNGEAFDPAEYPELAEAIPGGLAAMGTRAKSRTVGTSPGAAFGLGAYATDGVNQLAAYRFNSSSVSSNTPTENKVYWSSDNFKTKIQKTINPGYRHIRLFFVNGHWIAFTGDESTTSPYPTRFVYCRAQPEPFTDFSSYTNLASSNISNTGILDVFHVEYINGSYYAFCATYEMSRLDGNNLPISLSVLVSNSPDFQNAGVFVAWSNVMTLASSRVHFRFCKTEDKFVFFAFDSNWKLHYLAWSETPTGAYQQRTISADGQSASTWMGPPLVVDGKIVWTRTTTGSTYALSLAHLDDLENGTMGYVSLGKSAKNRYLCGLVDCGDGTYVFFTHDDSYIYVGQGNILQASSWTRGNLSAAPTWNNGVGIAYAKDGGVSTSKSGGILDIPQAAVPTVSIANCYTYVKAK